MLCMFWKGGQKVGRAWEPRALPFDHPFSFILSINARDIDFRGECVSALICQESRVAALWSGLAKWGPSSLAGKALNYTYLYISTYLGPLQMRSRNRDSQDISGSSNQINMPINFLTK